MRIPNRFAPILFSALLSAIMACIVSAFVLVISQDITSEFVTQWAKSCLTHGPLRSQRLQLYTLVRKLVGRMTSPA